ncbi:tyrosine-type recombinase/integrase [Candidatus Micrarchaeota archaeon]|nr:tyrosine-type recombinase/integrase [Candidatus Micrarchaeota archaeon]
MGETIYNYEKRLNKSISRVLSSPISEQNRKLILDFTNYSLVSDGVTKGTASRTIYHLLNLARWIQVDFDKATAEDVQRCAIEINSSDYKPKGKKELTQYLRKFYKWLRKTDTYPPEVAKIRFRYNRLQNRMLPEEVLTEADVEQMIHASTSTRDRAFLAVLYETGCRIGELLFLRIKHVAFDQVGALVWVTGKTGPRRIRIVSSVPHLAAWVNRHPQADKPEAYVWHGRMGVLSYDATKEVIRKLAFRAGIKKRVNPHAFRHARATFLARTMKESMMRQYFGWTGGSEMAAVYVHLSNRDTEDAILKLNGIELDESGRGESILKPRSCSRCAAKNASTNKVCSECNMPLDQSMYGKFTQADSMLDRLLLDPEVKAFLAQKIQGLAPGT